MALSWFWVSWSAYNKSKGKDISFWKVFLGNIVTPECKYIYIFFAIDISSPCFDFCECVLMKFLMKYLHIQRCSVNGDQGLLHLNHCTQPSLFYMSYQFFILFFTLAYLLIIVEIYLYTRAIYCRKDTGLNNMGHPSNIRIEHTIYCFYIRHQITSPLTNSWQKSLELHQASCFREKLEAQEP